MFEESNRVPKSPVVDPRIYLGFVMALIALYVGWIALGRWDENRTIERRAAAERAERQRDSDQAAIQQLGGSELAIQMFYASPPMVRRGETTTLCYGVANAKNVKLEPQSSPVWPSHSRCVDVKPTKETTYTLTIDDGTGHSLSKTLTVQVR
jgi:hypothetical protein